MFLKSYKINSSLRKTLSLMLLVTLFLVCLQKVTPLSAQEQGQVLPVGAKAIIGGEVIELEIAKTIEQQSLGLMYRKSLAPNRGMLFYFQPPRLTKFWMKNVIIPLDMIFIYKGEIKSIEANVPPCTTEPCLTYGPDETLIDQVIELRGGRTGELGVKVGDSIKVESLEKLQHH